MNGSTPSVVLRPVTTDDLFSFFAFQQDAEANRMAAFGAADPGDRVAFDRRWERIVRDPDRVVRAVVVDGALAGNIMLWRDPELDAPEVSYWNGRQFWGRGVATAALALLLDAIRTRPLYGRCASTNPGSRRVLEKCGFRLVRTDREVGATTGIVDEHLLLLE